MGGLDIGIGVDGDSLDAEVAAGADDPQRDLAAVGDEDPGERAVPVDVAYGGAGGWASHARHSGMLPCFFGGFVSRLSASISNAAMSRGRVSHGWITSSTYPRAAATYGLANRSS